MGGRAQRPQRDRESETLAIERRGQSAQRREQNGSTDYATTRTTHETTKNIHTDDGTEVKNI